MVIIIIIIITIIISDCSVTAVRIILSLDSNNVISVYYLIIICEDWLVMSSNAEYF